MTAVLSLTGRVAIGAEPSRVAHALAILTIAADAAIAICVGGARAAANWLVYCLEPATRLVGLDILCRRHGALRTDKLRIAPTDSAHTFPIRLGAITLLIARIVTQQVNIVTAHCLHLPYRRLTVRARAIGMANTLTVSAIPLEIRTVDTRIALPTSILLRLYVHRRTYVVSITILLTRILTIRSDEIVQAFAICRHPSSNVGAFALTKAPVSARGAIRATNHRHVHASSNSKVLQGSLAVRARAARVALTRPIDALTTELCTLKTLGAVSATDLRSRDPDTD